jgi:hypothetical protein
MDLPFENSLISVALALGARDVAGWSGSEECVARDVPILRSSDVAEFRKSILAGEDPLGESFCAIRSPEERRPRGATYTPYQIVRAMIAWASDYSAPARIVDPGTGSGRFLVEAGRRFPRARLLGIELDPVAAIVARGHLAAAGLAERSTVVVGDYRQFEIARIAGKTLFLGNPPYVRHHLIEPSWKQWFTDEAEKLGLRASQLAGLHIHFLLATAAKAAPGDYGVFITAAEWLDVNYGSAARDLFLNELGGQRMVILEPKAMPFPDAATTGLITCFEKGTEPRTVYVRRISNGEDLNKLEGGKPVSRRRLGTEDRWSHVTRNRPKSPAGYVPLGEICRVHRGQVTGANKFWIAGDHSADLPDSVLYPAITKARELYSAGQELTSASKLRRVIDLPVDLAEIDADDRPRVIEFLQKAKRFGADNGYVARNRKAWWSVGLKQPAPILATYMARRPPAFVLNRVGACHINIAHGLYPREQFSDPVLRNLVQFLSTNVSLLDGRTYAGGLTKFEPREMERFLVPEAAMLAEGEYG